MLTVFEKRTKRGKLSTVQLFTFTQAVHSSSVILFTQENARKIT